MQPRIVPEPAAKTPQDSDTVNLGPFNPTNLVHPASTQVCLGAEPFHGVPISFQYDLDSDFNAGQEEDVFPLTNNPCPQSYCPSPSRLGYDPSCHFMPSTHWQIGGPSTNHGIEPCQQFEWLDSDSDTRFGYCHIPQPNMSYVLSNASSTLPGNLECDIYAIPGSSSSHLTMTPTNDWTALPFPNYDANNYHM